MNVWAGLEARFAWRRSQAHLLQLAGHVTDRRWHLCAPPGAGKTLIGLELARQVGERTVVLAPTTAIRDQWRESTKMFGAVPGEFTSADPWEPAPLAALTYQLLGNPGVAAGELRMAARRLWVAELAADLGPEKAEHRVATTEAEDPDRARREVGRHVRTLRRSLSTGADVGVPREDLLGERTVDLIEQLAASGVGCVVLDECHRLLDWWALVMAALVERLGQDRDLAVVGLTATLPEPDSNRQRENYLGLLGEVDAELPMAAMVAEGGLAPWRDGVRLTSLTPREQAFLEDWAERFDAELDTILTGEPFVSWAVAQVTEPAVEASLDAALASTDGGALVPVGDGDPVQDGLADPSPPAKAGWDPFWDRDPLAAAALHRWWTARGMELPEDFQPPPGTEGPLDLDDRLTLLDAWLHDPVAGVRPELRSELRDLGSRYGVAFTTGGVRWGRSVADLVCSRSGAKGPAAADVLVEEAERRGDRLRALVVVEHDVATTAPAATRRALGEDAGTAARVLAALCERGLVAERGIVAVTGRGAWADALGAQRICAAMNVAGTADGRWVREEGCDIAGAVRLIGEGGGWTSARWLAAAEAALDDGAAQVLLATRGLVGEGWDHPALNVVVDLSDATTRTAATQLRGRAIRLDPEDPDKVASLWDVAAVHPTATGDWRRVRRRHRAWWGPAGDGTVVTGPAKLHPRLGLRHPPDPDDMKVVSTESAAAVADHEAAREAWRRLDPGGVAAATVQWESQPRPQRQQVRIRPADWERWKAAWDRDRAAKLKAWEKQCAAWRRRQTVGGIPRMVGCLLLYALGTAAGGFGFLLLGSSAFALDDESLAGLDQVAVLATLMVGAALFGGLAFVLIRWSGRVWDRLPEARELPPHLREFEEPDRPPAIFGGEERDEQATFQAVAEAVLDGLVRLGNDDLAEARVVVEPGAGGGWDATLDGADDDAVERWADALAETLGPLGTPRWMLAVGDRAWRVPAVVGGTRVAADTFAAAFEGRVPGTELLYAGQPRATELVLAAARQRSDVIGRRLGWRPSRKRSSELTTAGQL